MAAVVYGKWEDAMRKKSHISLARYLVREMKLDGLEKHKKAFYLGSILPDLTPKMITSPHEFSTSYDGLRCTIRSIAAEGVEEEWNERVLWRRVGVVLHYVADYFTFPHNTSFNGNLKDHCIYESEMKYYMREFVWTPEAKRIFRDAKRRAHNMKNTEELFAYIEEMHSSYMQDIHSVANDCRQILSLCATVTVVLAEFACTALELGFQTDYRCA